LYKIVPVILSGGFGTRLWPLSREQYPKQYLSLTDTNRTMLQETILRLKGLDNISDPIIVCNANHRFLVAEQCQQISVNNPIILLEPVGRNTAPAIAAAALKIIKDLDNSILLVLSADHLINDIESFQKAIYVAIRHAEIGKLVTFGIVPNLPNTGYGYIKYSKNNDNGAHLVEEFKEKPNLNKARSYIENGNYLWNSGMFIFRADAIIDELNVFSPEIIDSVNKSIEKAVQDLDFIRLDKLAFESSPSDSIDYALLEKSNNIVVIPLDADWNDIGSWSALYDIGSKDLNGNVIEGDVFTIDTSDSYINSNHHMMAVIGVDNLIIIDTPDATLISTNEKVHEVRSIVKSLKLTSRSEFEDHRKVYRPWGWYDSVLSGEHFQVKVLNVNPGEKLSLQKHHKRAEHWVVVSGLATVVNGDQELTLGKGDSTYIPIGVKHSLENKSTDQLKIIEVQSGVYLGEDDIVRFEDNYGRYDN